MALVNDDVAEIIFRVIFEKKLGIFLFTCYIEGLVGCDQDTGISLRIFGSYSRCISTEDILEGIKPLCA